MPQASPGGPRAGVGKVMCAEALQGAQAEQLIPGIIWGGGHRGMAPGVNIKVDSTSLIHSIS